MASFSGITIQERGAGGGRGFPVWSKSGVIVVKKIPGGDDTVIQIIGSALPRLAMPVKLTGSALASLQAAVGTTASLVFHFETASATLESVSDVRQFRTFDIWFCTLNFIRASTVFTIPGGGSGSLIIDSTLASVTDSDGALIYDAP